MIEDRTYSRHRNGHIECNGHVIIKKHWNQDHKVVGISFSWEKGNFIYVNKSFIGQKLISRKGNQVKIGPYVTDIIEEYGDTLVCEFNHRDPILCGQCGTDCCGDDPAYFDFETQLYYHEDCAEFM